MMTEKLSKLKLGVADVCQTVGDRVASLRRRSRNMTVNMMPAPVPLKVTTYRVELVDEWGRRWALNIDAFTEFQAINLIATMLDDWEHITNGWLVGMASDLEPRFAEPTATYQINLEDILRHEEAQPMRARPSTLRGDLDVHHDCA